MKLLMLTSSLGCGGAETHICSLAKALSKRGHRVTVASAGGVLVRELTEHGVAHKSIPLSKRNPVSLLIARKRLSRLLERESFDLVHAHARIPAFLAASLVKKRAIPMVTTVHARFRSGPLLRRLSRWGDSSIAVSEDLKQTLSEIYGVPSDHVRVIPNGIDTSVFSPSEGDEIPDEPPFLLFVSRLDRDCSRGAFLLCRMARELRKRFPNLQIRIAGGGEAFHDLLRLCRRINEEEGAVFLHAIGYTEDLRPLYRGALGVIGVSRVALEAMACGTPVILAGNEGMLGLVRGRLLFRAAAGNFCCRDGEPLTEEALKREILRLLSLSAQERQAFGNRLAEYVQSKHDLSKVAKETEDFYRDTLSHSVSSLPADLVLCGYYGYGNVGDDALLHASIRRAGALYPDYTLSALTRRGRKDASLFRIRCVNRKNPLAVARELKHAKVLVFGGGTLLQDQTSLRSLLWYASVLRYAHRRGLRIELWGNGLSLPRTALGERIIIDCLSRCHRVGLRDAPSLAWGISHVPEGMAGHFLPEKDLALGTLPSTDARAEFLCRRYGVDTCSAGFGIVTVRGGVGQGYLKILCSWLSMLRGERMRLLFVPMLPREDERLCRRLASLFGGTVTSSLSPSDLVGLMARARIVCGMRLHSLVFAACAETPFVGFGSDPKIEAFCREHGGVFFTDLY